MTESKSLCAARLGRTQVLALRLLAEGAKSVQHLEYDHFGPTAAAYRNAIMRLAMRGLADLAGWDAYGRRTYKLTEKGHEIERSLNRDEDDDG